MAAQRQKPRLPRGFFLGFLGSGLASKSVFHQMFHFSNLVEQFWTQLGISTADG